MYDLQSSVAMKQLSHQKVKVEVRPMHIKSIHTTIKLGIRYTNKEKRKIFKKIEPSLETLLS